IWEVVNIAHDKSLRADKAVRPVVGPWAVLVPKERPSGESSGSVSWVGFQSGSQSVRNEKLQSSSQALAKAGAESVIPGRPRRFDDQCENRIDSLDRDPLTNIGKIVRGLPTNRFTGTGCQCLVE